MLIFLQMLDSDDDKQKFKLIYDTYARKMYGLACALLRNESDAQDAVQHAFMAIIDNLGHIVEVEDPKTRSFIAIITKSKAIDIYRERKRGYDSRFVEEEVRVDMPIPGEHGLVSAMEQLPENYRNALLLCYDNGYSPKEIARMLNMTPGGVSKLLQRAKKALRDILEKEGCVL